MRLPLSFSLYSGYNHVLIYQHNKSHPPMQLKKDPPKYSLKPGALCLFCLNLQH